MYLSRISQHALPFWLGGPEGRGFTGRGKTRLACHSEESAILIGERRGISRCLENTESEVPRGVCPEQSEILRRVQDDSEGLGMTAWKALTRNGELRRD